MVTINALRQAGFEVREKLNHVKAITATFAGGQVNTICNDDALLRNAEKIEKADILGKTYVRKTE